MNSWQRALQRWVDAGLLDETAAARIREYEERHGSRSRWPVLLALSFGGLLFGAGILLFVAAHWDRLSAPGRIGTVLAALSAFHLAGALVAARLPWLATTLHAIGTVALGGAISMVGQIFHMDAHWPDAVLLWAIGAVAGYAVLRDWPQLTLAVVLAPAWLASETGRPQFLLLAALVCMAFTGNRGLVALGSVAVLPVALLLPLASSADWKALALLAAPLGIAVAALGRKSWPILAWAAWSAVFLSMDVKRDELALLAWAAIGSLGMVAWGWKDARTERINLGTAAFALTVLLFYFSRVMAALDRSWTLVSLGILFLAGGWILERTRRRLISEVRS